MQVLSLFCRLTEAGGRGKICIDHTGTGTLVTVEADPAVIIDLTGEDTQSGRDGGNAQLFIAFLNQQFVAPTIK